MNPSSFPVSWHPAHPNGYGSRQGFAPEAIVLHGTAGSAVAALSWFANDQAHVSAHFVVAADGTAYQCVSVQNAAYANGILEDGWQSRPMAGLIADDEEWNPNWWTIAIEHERTTDQMMSGEPMPDAQFEASCALSAWLWQTAIVPGGATGLALDRAHIGMHKDISPASRVYCPGWGEDEQARYISRVAALVGGGADSGQPPDHAQPSSAPTSGAGGPGAAPVGGTAQPSAGVPDPLVLQLVKISLDALGSAIGLMQSNTPEARGFAVQTIKAEAGALPE